MVKWTVIIGLWRKYKRHVSATLLCLIALILITLFHQDFIEFNDKSQTPYLALSYVIKWVSYLICIILYWLAIAKINRAAKFDSTLHSMMKSKKTQPATNTSINEGQKLEAPKRDPFAHLRNKKTLRSKADFIIESDKNN